MSKTIAGLAACSAWLLTFQEPKGVESQPTEPPREICVETSEGSVALVNPRTGQVRLRIGSEGAKAFVRSKDGRWLARLLLDDTVVVHDAHDGSELSRFETLPFAEPHRLEWTGPSEWTEWWDEDRCLQFAAANDRLVLARGHRATELWAVDPAERIAVLELQEGAPITALDVSADGAWIATGDQGGRIAAWSASNGDLRREAWQVTGPVTALNFDPTGARIAIGSQGCYVRVLELADGSLTELLPSRLLGTDSRKGIEDVRFDPSGNLLVVLSRTCGPGVYAWRTGSWSLAWERDLPVSWSGQGSVRFRADGARLLLGGPGITLDANDGSILCQPFPLGTDACIDTDGESAWSLESGILRLYTFEPCVGIRDLRLN